MEQLDRYCPQCEERRKWYDSECPECGAALAEVPPEQQPAPDTALIAVLRTRERGLLPLVCIVLEQEGIEYVVQNTGLSDTIIGQRPMLTFGDTRAPLAVLVRAEDEPRARELVGDLERTPDENDGG